MILAPSAALSLFSAIFGIVGTGLMFFGSYALEPFEGATWGGPETAAANDRIRAKNRTRLLMQRSGVALLFVAFVLQGIAAFAPS